ncbi:MAG: hypothetical protein KDA83_07575 [Planctomycetales bacterium]|nr:hypothetical protein [Planctomycetales bacterium]
MNVGNREGFPFDICEGASAMKRVTSGLVPLMLLLIGGCCYPEFEHPIIKPSEAPRYEELFGLHREVEPQNGVTTWLHIGGFDGDVPKGIHRFVWVSDSSPDRATSRLDVADLPGFIFKVDQTYIIQCPSMPNEPSPRLSIEQLDFDHVKTFWIFRLQKVGEDLRWDCLDPNAIKDLIEQGALKGEVEFEEREATEGEVAVSRVKRITVTASSDELQRFFRKVDLDSIFLSNGPRFARVEAE